MWADGGPGPGKGPSTATNGASPRGIGAETEARLVAKGATGRTGPGAAFCCVEGASKKSKSSSVNIPKLSSTS